MNNINHGDKDSSRLLDFMFDMAEELNKVKGKTLIRTHFFNTKDQLLGHTKGNHMLGNLLCAMVDDVLNCSLPNYLRQIMCHAINDDLEIYIHVSDIRRLGVLKDITISKIKPKGLLLPNGNWIKMHRFKQGIAYSWESLKTEVQ